MNTTHTKNDLIAFEEKIVKLFSEKKIKAPVHLDSGNEEQLIDVFTNYVNKNDWACGSWRMHYKTLLKGVPEEELIEAIVAGKSISLCFPKYNIISSAIVAGILPIALGIAMGIKRKNGSNKVVVFSGDMTVQTGAFHECYQYALNHQLPILFVIEDNNKSVCTDTRATWGCKKLFYEPEEYKGGVDNSIPNILYYRYNSRYPHAGGGERIQF